jgi:hypothetical protein
MQEWERKGRYTELLSEYAAVTREIEELRRKQQDARRRLEELGKNGFKPMSFSYPYTPSLSANEKLR